MINTDHNYPRSALTGGLLGYTAKYVIPVLKHEKGVEYEEFMRQFRDYSDSIKNTRIAELKSGSVKHPGVPIYLDVMSVGENSLEGKAKLSKLNENEYAWFRGLKNQINREIDEPIKAGNKVFASLKKAVRPTGAFIAIGAITGIICHSISKKHEKHKELIA